MNRGERTGARPGALGLFAWVSLLPFLAACGSDDGPPTAGEPLPQGVDTAVRGMRTFITRDGIRRALVEADTAEWRVGNQIHMRAMTLTFFDLSGLESTEVTSENGIFFQLTGDVEAEGRVVVEDRVDDQRLETERLDYRHVDGRLYGETAFRLLHDTEGVTLQGTGFESDPALDSVIVLNQEGEMRPGVAFSEAVPLPAVPAGDTAEAAAEPAAGEPAAVDPAALPVPGDSTIADLDPAVGVDAAAAPPDSLEAPADTAAAAPPDSVEAPPDTTAAVTPPDSVEAPPDTTAAVTPPDSLGAPPDTAQAVAPPDSLGAPPDTTATARR